MQIISWRDNSHEMLKPIFWENEEIRQLNIDSESGEGYRLRSHVV